MRKKTEARQNKLAALKFGPGARVRNAEAYLADAARLINQARDLLTDGTPGVVKTHDDVRGTKTEIEALRAMVVRLDDTVTNLTAWKAFLRRLRG